MCKNAKKKSDESTLHLTRHGFTLAEILIGMLIAVLSAAGIIKGLVFANAMSEKNLCEQAAFALSVNIVEQLKSHTFSKLEEVSQLKNPTISLYTNSNSLQQLFLGAPNSIPIEVIATGSSGTDQKRNILVELTPAITELEKAVLLIEVEYAFDDPLLNRSQTRSLKFISTQL